MILQPIQILIPFPAVVAAVGFMFRHAQGARVPLEGVRVDDGEGAVFIRGEFLLVVAMLGGYVSRI